MTAITDLIADVNGAKYSDGNQNLICQIATFITAMQYIEAGLVPAGAEAANTFYAGPVTGAPALPAFRAIGVADLSTPLGAGTLAALLLSAAGQFGFNGRAQAASPADGIITLFNAALTDFTRLNLGGATAAFPALQRTAAALQAELADGSALANFICSQLQPSQTAGILGTTTNNDANAGSVGEAPSASQAVSVALTSPNPADVKALALTAGDWEVSGTVLIAPAGGATVTVFKGWISATSATEPADPGLGAYFLQTAASALNQGFPTGTTRITLASPASVFLSARCNFAAGTVNAGGFIKARRPR